MFRYALCLIIVLVATSQVGAGWRHRTVVKVRAADCSAPAVAVTAQTPPAALPKPPATTTATVTSSTSLTVTGGCANGQCPTVTVTRGLFRRR